MSIMLLFSLLASSMYYLGSRAVITRALWSRYPLWIAHWADCSACSSFWYGITITITIGRHYGLEYLGLDPYDVFTPIIVGLGCMTTTPIVAGMMQAGFEQLGSAVDESGSQDG